MPQLHWTVPPLTNWLCQGSQEKEVHIDLDGLSDELPDNDVLTDRILKLAGLIN